MPIKQSAIKHLRQTKTRTSRNVKVKRELREFVKAVRKTVTAGDKEKLQNHVVKIQKIFDKAAKKGIIKKNNAARRKSRLIKQVQTAVAK